MSDIDEKAAKYMQAYELVSWCKEQEFANSPNWWAFVEVVKIIDQQLGYFYRAKAKEAGE